jgi:hypothetical protein
MPTTTDVNEVMPGDSDEPRAELHPEVIALADRLRVPLLARRDIREVYWSEVNAPVYVPPIARRCLDIDKATGEDSAAVHHFDAD